MYIVDDDVSVLRSLGRLLEVHGYETRRFSSAAELLATDMPADDTCLILDIAMPTLDGFGLHAELLRRNCKAPTIIITAIDEPETRRRAMRMGAVGFLCKPFEGQVLLETIGHAMRSAVGDGEGGKS